MVNILRLVSKPQQPSGFSLWAVQIVGQSPQAFLVLCTLRHPQHPKMHDGLARKGVDRLRGSYMSGMAHLSGHMRRCQR